MMPSYVNEPCTKACWTAGTPRPVDAPPIPNHRGPHLRCDRRTHTLSGTTQAACVQCEHTGYSFTSVCILSRCQRNAQQTRNRRGWRLAGVFSLGGTRRGSFVKHLKRSSAYVLIQYQAHGVTSMTIMAAQPSLCAQSRHTRTTPSLDFPVAYRKQLPPGIALCRPDIKPTGSTCPTAPRRGTR